MKKVFVYYFLTGCSCDAVHSVRTCRNNADRSPADRGPADQGSTNR